jgi:hypothetical protein
MRCSRVQLDFNGHSNRDDLNAILNTAFTYFNLSILLLISSA